jgi:hypothetical protein
MFGSLSRLMAGTWSVAAFGLIRSPSSTGNKTVNSRLAPACTHVARLPIAAASFSGQRLMAQYESDKQFSLNRAAFTTCGGAKTNFLSDLMPPEGGLHEG